MTSTSTRHTKVAVGSRHNVVPIKCHPRLTDQEGESSDMSAVAIVIIRVDWL